MYSVRLLYAQNAFFIFRAYPEASSVTFVGCFLWIVTCTCRRTTGKTFWKNYRSPCRRKKCKSANSGNGPNNSRVLGLFWRWHIWVAWRGSQCKDWKVLDIILVGYHCLWEETAIDFSNVLLFSCRFDINDNIIEQQILFLTAYAVRNHASNKLSSMSTFVHVWRAFTTSCNLCRNEI